MATLIVGYQSSCTLTVLEIGENGAFECGQLFAVPEGRTGCRGFWPLANGSYLTCDVDTVYLLSANGIMTALSHPSFGDLHGVCEGPNANSFYVASSEADAILLADWSGEIQWAWQGGSAIGDVRGRGRGSAREHLMHPNSVFPVYDGVVFSAFGPLSGYDENGRPFWDEGVILRAGPMRTTETLKSRLKCPHSVRITNGVLSYAESAASRVIFGDGAYSMPELLWAKCAVPYEDGMIVGCEDKTLRFYGDDKVVWTHALRDVPYVMDWMEA